MVKAFNALTLSDSDTTFASYFDSNAVFHTTAHYSVGRGNILDIRGDRSTQTKVASVVIRTISLLSQSI